MSQFRFEKRRVSATLTLAPGDSVTGCFFLAGQTAHRASGERIGDLLNSQPGFFPFQLADGATVLYNRAHVVAVAIDAGLREAELDPGYDAALHQPVGMLLSTGMRVTGQVAIYASPGHDRLSDYTCLPQTFRYVVTPSHTLIVNAAHIVELTEVGD